MISTIDGSAFYETIVRMGEKVTFLTDPEVIQYASITPHRTTNTTDGAYWYTGAMTFDGVEQQNSLLGEYFIRQTNSQPKNILTAVMPENTTPKMATVYSVECNETIDIISHYEDTGEVNKYGEKIMAPVFLSEGVDVYMTMVLLENKNTVAGGLVETVTNLVIPARFTISYENTILKKSFVFDNVEKKNKIAEIKYRVQSIDTSMMDIIDDKPVGILKCLLTEDTR